MGKLTTVIISTLVRIKATLPMMDSVRIAAGTLKLVCSLSLLEYKDLVVSDRQTLHPSFSKV